MDIQSASWKEILSLPSAIHSFGIVEMDGIIYIVGGEGNDGAILDTVYIFDTVTNMVTVHDERLTFTVRNPAVITVNQTLYVFGNGQMAKMDMTKAVSGRRLLSVAPTVQPTPGAKLGKAAEAESESREWYIIIPVLATSGVLILFCVAQCLCKRAAAKRIQSVEAQVVAMESPDVESGNDSNESGDGLTVKNEATTTANEV